MLRAFLFWAQSRLKTRQIAHNGQPYLERSYLATLPGVRVYLHRFVACDEDGVHDHPFLFSLSFILAGWYWEDRWARRYLRKWLNFIGPEAMHRVVLPNNGRDVWTLFFHTERVKPWGFLRAVGHDQHGPRYEYRPESQVEDAGFSDWSKDVSGAVLRASGKMFDIPLGRNAYAVGLMPYPESAIEHSVGLVVDQPRGSVTM